MISLFVQVSFCQQQNKNYVLCAERAVHTILLFISNNKCFEIYSQHTNLDLNLANTSLRSHYLFYQEILRYSNHLYNQYLCIVPNANAVFLRLLRAITISRITWTKIKVIIIPDVCDLVNHMYGTVRKLIITIDKIRPYNGHNHS